MAKVRWILMAFSTVGREQCTWVFCWKAKVCWRYARLSSIIWSCDHCTWGKKSEQGVFEWMEIINTSQGMKSMWALLMKLLTRRPFPNWMILRESVQKKILESGNRECSLIADNIAKYHQLPRDSSDNLSHFFIGRKPQSFIWNILFY